jgi:hypothetical protein
MGIIELQKIYTVPISTFSFLTVISKQLHEINYSIYRTLYKTRVIIK